MSVLHRPVLVVDDSDVIRRVVCDQLKHHGVHDIVMAEDAEKAIEEYEAHRPGLVFLDITMPEVPGTRVARHVLRADPYAKVVVMTAMSRDKDLVESAIADGAYAYLRKPITDQDLRGLLERLRSEEGRAGPPHEDVHPWGGSTAAL